MELKQVIVVRKDLDLPKGKLGAQVAHAAVEACYSSDSKMVLKWRNQGAKKVVLKVENEKALLLVKQDAEDAGLTTALITDAGKTVIAPGTVTCLGIGPDSEEKIDKITGKLSML